MTWSDAVQAARRVGVLAVALMGLCVISLAASAADVQLCSIEVGFGEAICRIPEDPGSCSSQGEAVYCSACVGADARTCSPQILPGEEVRITPNIVATREQDSSDEVLVVDVRVSWRRQDKTVECGYLAAEIDPAGEPIVVSVDSTGLAPGCYIFTVWADPEGKVSGDDESDNRLSFCVLIEDPRPNLHPTSLRTTQPSPIEQGEALLLQTEILNTGRAPAGPFTVFFVAASSSLPPCGYVDLGWEESETMEILGSVNVSGLERDENTVLSLPIDTMSLEGTLAIQAMIDPIVQGIGSASDVAEGNAVDESEETDNCVSTLITIAENPRRLPELHPISLTLEPESPLAWGTSTVATVTITNSGGSAPFSSMDEPVDPEQAFVGLSFSYRPRGDSEAQWRRLETYQVGQPTETTELRVPPSELGIEEDNNTAIRSVRLRFDQSDPNSVKPGEYELRVIVDPPGPGQMTGVVREQDETNNSLIIAFTIFGAELHPTSLEASGPVEQGDTIAVLADIVNTGDREEGSFTVGFYIDAARMDTFFYSEATGLETGDVATARGFIDTSDLLVGTHTLRVIVDPENQIAEVDEANNEISMQVEIRAPLARSPELLVEAVTIGDGFGNLPMSEEGRVRATISNRGNLTAEQVPVGFFLARSSVNLLNSNTWPKLASDLVPCLGSEATGQSDPCSVSDAAWQWIPRLEPGERIDVSWTVNAAVPRGYNLWVIVDPSNEILEQDDSNNAMTFSFGELVGDTDDDDNVQGMNLTCLGLSVASEGGFSVARGEVRNNGMEETGAFQVEWFIVVSGRSIFRETSHVEGLAAGETASVSYVIGTASLPPGGYNLVMRVDATGQVAETNEQDNECQRVVYVGYDEDPTSNLVISSVQFSPPCSPPCSPNGAEVIVGERVIALVNVQNQGNVSVGPFVVRFAVADAQGVTVGSQRVAWPGLEAMAEAQISYAFDTLTEGTFTVSVVVDADGEISETSKTDNLAQATFLVDPSSAVSSDLILERDGRTIVGLHANPSSDTLYSIWSDGSVFASGPEGEARLVYAAGDSVSAFAPSEKGSPVLILAAAGQLHRVELASGASTLGAQGLGSPVTAIALAENGSVFAATTASLYVLSRDLQIAGQSSISGAVVQLAYDDARDVLYVLTSNGLFAYGPDLDPLCEASLFVGAPSALELGSTGLYLGTSAGYVYAMSYCMSHGGSPPLIVDSWRYPSTAASSVPVAAIANDPRGFDPIYVAAEGITALAYGGGSLWTYPSDGTQLGTIVSDIAVEERTGRLFFVDASGTPHLVDANGKRVQLGISTSGSATGFAAVALDEYRTETTAGTRLIRAYYYGMGDSVFRIESDR